MSDTNETQDRPLTFAECLEARNALARECADLRDSMATLKAEQAERQEATTRALAEIRLSTGKSVEDVTDEVYEDTHKVLQALKDRVWEQGYRDGLHEARNAMNQLYDRERSVMSAIVVRNYFARWRLHSTNRWSKVHWFRDALPACGLPEPDGEYDFDLPPEPTITCRKCQRLNKAAMSS